eukprot:4384170-Amphidinium_carterae.1
MKFTGNAHDVPTFGGTSSSDLPGAWCLQCTMCTCGQIWIYRDTLQNLGGVEEIVTRGLAAGSSCEWRPHYCSFPSSGCPSLVVKRVSSEKTLTQAMSY